MLNLTTALRAGSLVVGLAAASILSQSAAWADTLESVPVLHQWNGAWSSQPLGTSRSETIGSAGCTVTAAAMVLKYYGVATDPAQLNAWLTANGGYAEKDLLIWNSLGPASHERVEFIAWLGPDLTLINAELDAGRPVIAEVTLNREQHFVTLVGRTGSGYVANDPWFGDRINFSERYGDPASAIASIRTLAPAPSVGSLAAFAAPVLQIPTLAILKQPAIS